MNRLEATDGGPNPLRTLPAPSAGWPKRALVAVAAVLWMVLGIITAVATSGDVPDVSGTRTGMWNVENAGGTVALTVRQNGSMVAGDIAFKVDLKGAQDYSSGPISGTVSERNGQHVLSFSSGRLRADLEISDTEIKGPFCFQLCGTMSFAR